LLLWFGEMAEEGIGAVELFVAHGLELIQGEGSGLWFAECIEGFAAKPCDLISGDGLELFALEA